MPAHRAHAFSLIEILVVLTIMTIGTGVALYSYSSYRRSIVLTSSASNVQRTLMQARSRAIHLNAPHRVFIDIDNDTVWVNQLNHTKTQSIPKVVPETSVGDFVTIQEIRIGSTTYTSGTRTVDFETDGGNPLVIVNLRRLAGDPASEESYTAVRLYPASGEAQVLPKRRL